MLRTESKPDPFQSPAVASQAVRVLARAEAMGLLPPGEMVGRLDWEIFRKLVRRIQQSGIARGVVLTAQPVAGALESSLAVLDLALEESPVPENEFRRLSELLGSDLLGRLLAVSASSLRRYMSATRATPLAVARRLHYLALVAGFLGGAYNEFGIRQWFGRPRAQLAGRSPADILKPGWEPGQEGPRKVYQLAEWLTGSPAT